MVTLTGVGGVGKTRLALQVAADTVTRFPDGVWFVDLGPVLDAGFVPAAVSTALALPERRQGTVEDSIVAALRNKRLLVVLDNCEQVVDAAAALVDVARRVVPGGEGALATSREALEVDGEVTYPVRPLATPPADEVPALTRCSKTTRSACSWNGPGRPSASSSCRATRLLPSRSCAGVSTASRWRSSSRPRASR